MANRLFEMMCILGFFALIAAIPAICKVIWYGVKVFFTAKIARIGWGK